MSEKNTLIIVESPTKAKTITKFLPKTYKVVASNGHVRDLPEERMAIKIEKGFAAEYEPVKGKQRLIADLKKELKDADRLLLATDEDRDG